MKLEATQVNNVLYSAGGSFVASICALGDREVHNAVLNLSALLRPELEKR